MENISIEYRITFFLESVKLGPLILSLAEGQQFVKSYITYWYLINYVSWNMQKITVGSGNAAWAL